MRVWWHMEGYQAHRLFLRYPADLVPPASEDMARN